MVRGDIGELSKGTPCLMQPESLTEDGAGAGAKTSLEAMVLNQAEVVVTWTGVAEQRRL